MGNKYVSAPNCSDISAPPSRKLVKLGDMVIPKVTLIGDSNLGNIKSVKLSANIKVTMNRGQTSLQLAGSLEAWEE